MKFYGLIALSIFSLLSTTAFSREGSSVRGGGNELVAKFLGTAQSLMLEVKFRAEEKKYLTLALEKTKVVSVPVLLDPETGKPIPHQEKMVAWADVNYVQIKEKSKSPDVDSFELMVEQGRPIAHIVIHELIRASGWTNAEGRSPDEQFELSIGRYHLNEHFDDTRSMWLYAQCEVKSCERIGPSLGDDVVCQDGPTEFTMAWSKATVQVFKYQGFNPTQRARGLLGITNFHFPLEQRFGTQVLDNIKIEDDAKGISVLPLNRDQRYRNFRIEHGTKPGQITRGHAEISFGKARENGRWKERWVVLELACQTGGDFLRGE